MTYGMKLSRQYSLSVLLFCSLSVCSVDSFAGFKLKTPKISPPKINPPSIAPPKIPKINPPKINPPKSNPPKIHPPQANTQQFNPNLTTPGGGPIINVPNFDPRGVGHRIGEIGKNFDPFNQNAAIRDPLRAARETGASTVGEAGRDLYPAAADAMAFRHARLPHSIIAPWDKNALRVHFGDLVDEVRVVWGAQPLNRWGDLHLGGTDAGAQTYGEVIYVNFNPHAVSDYQRLSTLAHELVHVQQVRRFGGMRGFGYHYFRDWAKDGFSYDRIDLEEEAYAVETGPAMERIWEAFRAENTHQIDLINRTGNQISMSWMVNGEVQEPVTFAPFGSKWFRGVGRPPRFTVSTDVDMTSGVNIVSFDIPAGRTFEIVSDGNRLRIVDAAERESVSGASSSIPTQQVGTSSQSLRSKSPDRSWHNRRILKQ